jgi:hypothetical protein
MTVQDVCDLIAGYRYRYRGEHDLQNAIAEVLKTAQLEVHREVRLSGQDRIDFLVEPEQLGLGIEVKVAGDAASAIRQLARYATFPQIRQLLLVTTRYTHRGSVPAELGGKPVTTLHVRSAL